MDKAKLVHDEHLAVPLITLEPGATFKLPDWPDAGLPGKRGKLLYANPSRARVQFDAEARTFTARTVNADGNEETSTVTLSRGGEIDISANTMVIPL